MKKLTCLLVGFLSLIETFATANEFFFNVDYLYWYTLQSSMSYAVIVENISALMNPTIVPQTQNWNSGVRLQGGYHLPCGFDTTFSWTHFNSSDEGSVSNPIIVATELLSPTVGFVIGGDGVGGPASSQWNLHFNIFDVDFGVLGFENCRYFMHPFIGIRGGTINQNQLIVYENFLDTNTSEIVNASVDQINNLWLTGPKIGFNSAYQLGCGFSLIGDFSVSLLYGRLRSQAHSITSEPGIDINSILRNTKNRIVPNFHTLIGLGYDCCLSNRYLIFAMIGYEVEYFFHTWRVVNSNIQTFYITNSGFGDLMLNGLTVSLGVSF